MPRGDGSGPDGQGPVGRGVGGRGVSGRGVDGRGRGGCGRGGGGGGSSRKGSRGGACQRGGGARGNQMGPGQAVRQPQLGRKSQVQIETISADETVAESATTDLEALKRQAEAYAQHLENIEARIAELEASPKASTASTEST